MELKIEYLPIEDLTPYERNARKHEAADVQTIANSITEFEMCDPIGVWGYKNIIVEGHGRVLALKQLGRTQAPCIRLDHLTDEQRRAYALAHNKTAEMSSWDFENLASEMSELETDMTQFGFAAETENVNIDDFFTDAEPKEKEPQKIQCPHCGAWFAK
jgi:ParB-like chromosome segregation protein Spo0J